MAALPPSGVVLAATRWLDLLTRSDVTQAESLLRGSADFADLTWTQYANALDLLRSAGLVTKFGRTGTLQPELRDLDPERLRTHLLQELLRSADPPWLHDADELIPDASDIPADVLATARQLKVPEERAIEAIRSAWGRVDAELREELGRDGELAVVAALAAVGFTSIEHVALDSDAFGYDVRVQLADGTWHLEVKATRRRGRLVIFLSRHEFEVAQRDPRWRLVVAGLTEGSILGALAVVRGETLVEATPGDQDPRGRWESVRLRLTGADSDPGLPFLVVPPPTRATRAGLLIRGLAPDSGEFGWMPEVASFWAHPPNGGPR